MRERGGPVGQQAGYLRLDLGERERWLRQRYRETYKQRDRADNKNPEQSWVAQLVIYNFSFSKLALYHSFLLTLINKSVVSGLKKEIIHINVLDSYFCFFLVYSLNILNKQFYFLV